MVRKLESLIEVLRATGEEALYIKVKDKYPNRYNYSKWIARKLLYKTPFDSPEFNEETFWQELEEYIQKPTKPVKIHITKVTK